jgi:two-component system, cell cycle response regulator
LSDPSEGRPADVESDQLDELYELVLGARAAGRSREEKFTQLRDALSEIRAFATSLAAGDLQYRLSVRGPVAGPLKALGANLKHMTWQAKEITAGDLSQRIDYLGEFSIAFNDMAQRLDTTLTELRAREHELSEANESLRDAHAQLVEQATHDPLTGLLNRRTLSERWTGETARADRYGRRMTVIVADLDKFKEINDTCGHEGGDSVLRLFAQTVSRETRGSDIACRMGGDEFLVLLPETPMEKGALVAERIRYGFELADIGLSSATCTHTASLGVAEYPTHGGTLEEVTRAADEALYRVKGRGRNHVVCAVACE